MFSNLFYEVWPAIGRAFGLLSAIAEMSTQDFIDQFFYLQFTGGYFEFLNVFTGEIEVFDYILADIIAFANLLPVVGGMLNIVFAPYLHLAVWETLVICSCGIFFIIYFIKFLLSFI